jgi:hypothetical protein
MKAHKDSGEQMELWEAMDVVIGAAPISWQRKQASPSLEDIQPILDRIEERERQRKRFACAAA